MSGLAVHPIPVSRLTKILAALSFLLSASGAIAAPTQDIPSRLLPPKKKAAITLAVAVPSPVTKTTPQAIEQTLEITLKPCPTGVRKIVLRRQPHASPSYRITFKDGQTRQLTPDALAALMLKDQNKRGWLFTILNISNPLEIIWVSIGLLGQVLFTGRMIVQWLASEKHKRSVIPIAFWWMSLSGATLLITYFIWRHDIVGVLGQATGWFIYIRNIMLIYRHKQTDTLL